MPDVDYLQYAQLMNQRNPFAESLAGIGKTLQAGRQQDIQEEQMRRAARLSDIQARSGEATLAGTLAEQEGMRQAYGAENLPGAYAAKEKATIQSAAQKQAMEKGGLIKDMFDKTYSAVKSDVMTPEEAETFFRGTMKMSGIDFDQAGMKFSFSKKGGYYSGPINEQSLFMMNGKPVPFGNKGIVEKAHVVGVAPDGVSPIYQMDENTKFTEPKAPEYKSRERIAGNKTIFEESQDGGRTWKKVSEGPRYKPTAGGTPRKPMPPAALKMQQEGVDAISMASNIGADLGEIKRQVDSGELPLGPIRNLLSRGQNVAGLSSPESRKFATFRASLEKLRNDSLRLNKGVQTEGDAQRAWNELMTNITDETLVSERLDEIQRINERAVDLQKMNIENIRENYGQSPLETGRVERPTPAVGKSVAKRPPLSSFRKR